MKQSLMMSLILAAATLHAQDFRVGSKVTDFQVQDLDGKSLSFFTLRGPITVVTFIATQCPVSNAYNQRMIALYNDYAPKGVKFIFVNANRTEAASEVRNHAQHAGFPFPVYKDANNIVANHFGAEVTPESYAIDGSGVLQYHGSIDDSQNEARIRTRRLRLALDSLLSGKPVDATETKAFGCTIKRVRKST